MLFNRVDNISASFKLALNVTHELCELINTPRSLAVSLMLQYECWEDYLSLSIDASTYEDPQHFAEDYLITGILSKHPDIPIDIDRSRAALDSFIESEDRCYLTNVRLRSVTPEWYFSFRRTLYRILGPLSTRELSFVDNHFRFGPGATTSVRGIGSSPSDKYDGPLHLTANLVPYVRQILGETWWESRRSPFEVVHGNKFTTVPKNAKTDRGICVEPDLNIYVQLGIGQLIRSRLKRFGLDLNSQERNRELAQRAYSDELVTIDLSSASDSVSTELVLQYFPERWIELLALPRSGFTKLPNGNLVELEKWSSMGNGYTFELESCIFYALCLTIIPFDLHDQISVYGDDIIIPRRYAGPLIEALEFLGFRVNHSKSFLAGNFFESCGCDYFKGHNVRPFHLKGEVGFIPYQVQVANRLRLYASRITPLEYSDRKYYPLWKKLVQSAPRLWRRCFVPVYFGDCGIIGTADEAAAPRAKDGLEARVVRHVVFQPRVKRKTSLGLLLSKLPRGSGGGSFVNYDPFPVTNIVFSKGREPMRGLFGRPRTKMTVDNWPSCGIEWSP